MTFSSLARRSTVDVTQRSIRSSFALVWEIENMAHRLAGMLLAALLTIGLSGCARDPFACCDCRVSLADWFDMYGPTGCYYPDGSPRCADGRCR
jgi:hypothetical protein